MNCFDPVRPRSPSSVDLVLEDVPVGFAPQRTQHQRILCDISSLVPSLASTFGSTRTIFLAQCKVWPASTIYWYFCGCEHEVSIAEIILSRKANQKDRLQIDLVR